MLLRALPVVVLLASVLACGADEGAVEPPGDEVQLDTDLVVTEPDAPVEIAVGETFALRVAANPSIGYAWDVVAPTDDRVVRDDGFVYLPPEGDVAEGEVAAGDDVTVDHRFEAVAPGTVTVVLRRSYRGDAEDPPVERVHEVTVLP